MCFFAQFSVGMERKMAGAKNRLFFLETIGYCSQMKRGNYESGII